MTTASPARAATAGRLDLQLVASSTNPFDHWDISLQARVTGTAHPGQGDGGLADLQFSIISTDTGRSDAVAAGVGPLAGKARIIWNTTVTSTFGVVGPIRADLGNDGDFDVVGGAFFDTNNFTRTDFALAGWTTIATLQFRINGLSTSHLAVIPEFPQYYDFVTGQGNGFRSSFASIYTAGVTIGTLTPITDALTLFPEPAALAPASLFAVTALRRRVRC